MNILVFSNFPPFVMGGAENQVARLVECWSDLGHSIEVAGYDIPNQKAILGRHSIELHHLYVFDRAGRFGRGLSYFFSLLFFLIRHGRRFNIIYTRGLADAAISVCIAKMLKLCRVPLVACPINSGGKGDINFITSIPGNRYFVKLINYHCDGINSIAPGIRDDLKKVGIEVRHFEDIPNGIAFLPLHRASRKPGAMRLLFTGRFSYQKGLDLLINSFRVLREERFDFHCDIVGDGPLRHEVGRAIDIFGLSDCVTLKNSVDRKLVRDLLLQVDVFVMPSRYEGMSNSVLEAMESGLPVLVTRCGGIDHYISTDNGWTCNPNDQQSLTKALRLMLLTPFSKLQSMGNANRTLVQKYFAIEKIARANIAFFNSVIEGSANNQGPNNL